MQLDILYVHGFRGSSGESAAVVKRCLEKHGCDVNMTAPELDLADFDSVKAYLEHREHFDFIIASSLGCGYVMSFCGGPHKILIDPVFPDDTDGTPAADRLKAALAFKKEVKDWEDNIETYFIFGTDDEAMKHYRRIIDEYHYLDSHCFFVDDMPRDVNEMIEDVLVDVVKKSLASEEVYRDFDPISYVLENLMESD